MLHTRVDVISDNQYISTAERIITQAKKEILLSTFKLQLSAGSKGRRFMTIYTALLKAQARGVKIKVLAHYAPKPETVPYSNAGCMRMLRAKGIEVRYLPRGRIAHAKILLIDTKVLLTGSHNWSLKSLTYNFEMSLLVTDSLSIVQAHVFFLRTWERAITFE